MELCILSPELNMYVGISGAEENMIQNMINRMCQTQCIDTSELFLAFSLDFNKTNVDPKIECCVISYTDLRLREDT